MQVNELLNHLKMHDENLFENKSANILNYWFFLNAKASNFLICVLDPRPHSFYPARSTHTQKVSNRKSV